MKLNLIYNTFKDISIVGVDQEKAINFCKDKHKFGEFYIDYFENPTVKNLKADLIICADFIEHLNKPELLLNYIKQNLNEGGFILLSTLERDLLRGKSNLTPLNKFHIRELNKEELKEFLTSEGFKIIKHKLQFPVKLRRNRLMNKEVISRFKEGKPLKYNQGYAS
mgnify:CR=1 FL=1